MINLEYKDDILLINGNGKVLFQKTEDLISYKYEVLGQGQIRK